jgi:hypothetical protein
MRRNLLKPLLACLLFLGGITASIGQTTTLISYTNQWSYLVTNALPPGGWTNVSYPAAAGWPTGPAPMASAGEAMPGGVPALRTTLDLNYNGNFVTSYYFRASVTVPSNPSNLIFTVSAAIDDGAVFYVNGRRIQNLRMTTGAVTHNTFALNDGGGDVSARPLDTFTIPSTNFVQGDNVIAVSVHQVNGTSTDIAFAMELRTDVIEPPVIVQQPESQTVQVGRRAVFEVEATGTALFYRWFTNGVLIPSSNTNSYTTPITTLAMDGIVYHVVVSNAVGRVQSQTATLRVVPDTFGPQPILAFMNRSNWVEFRFDETLHVSSTNSPTNFVIHVLGTGEKLMGTNVVFASTTRTSVTVRLREVLGPPTNYVVCAYNISDNLTNTLGGPFVSASACAPLIFTNVITLFPFADLWRWNDSQYLLGNTPPTNSSPTVDWKHINYPDTVTPWREGSAPLHDDFTPPTVDCTSGTGDGLDRIATTSYIRKRFTVSTNLPVGANLLIRHQIDDGAVFYLNGREIYRVNMPAGTPGYGTFATAQVEGNCTSVSLLPAMTTNVIRGQNILAIEVHQFNEVGQVDWDTYFDVELSVALPVAPIIPDVTVTRTNTPAPSVSLRWQTNAPGWQLQSAAAITGPWTAVTPPPPAPFTNYVAPVSGGPQRFYRLVNPSQP